MNDYSSIFVILMGLGTVFFGLICLIALTTIMGRVLEGRAAPVPAVPATAPVMPVPPAPDRGPVRPELAAAIAAAVAEDMGASVTGIRILSMRRV